MRLALALLTLRQRAFYLLKAYDYIQSVPKLILALDEKVRVMLKFGARHTYAVCKSRKLLLRADPW